MLLYLLYTCSITPGRNQRFLGACYIYIEYRLLSTLFYRHYRGYTTEDVLRGVCYRWYTTGGILLGYAIGDMLCGISYPGYTTWGILRGVYYVGYTTWGILRGVYYEEYTVRGILHGGCYMRCITMDIQPRVCFTALYCTKCTMHIG
jgi:hypothetical protein